MKLPLAYYGDPILRKKGKLIKKFDEELKKLVDDMIETMIEEDGVGLAAPQVHKSLLLFVTNSPIYNEEAKDWEDGQVRVFVNPRIIEKSKEMWDFDEGCLSIPKVYGKVPRHWTIKIEYQDLMGKVHLEEFSGYESRVIQHEFDHINGVLFIDRILGRERQEMEAALKAIKVKYS